MSDVAPDEIEDLVTQLKAYNDAYRRGVPLISDPEYDRLVNRLQTLDPLHPFLSKVEPELFEGKKEIRHPVPMLSIEKAYSREALERFISRVKKEAAEIGIQDIRFSVTPKLDGLAGRDDGEIFASRGNGEVGYEISSAFEKGI
ncbi:MAG: DNA ligase, partial [Deltaproteobacteria bacterium]